MGEERAGLVGCFRAYFIKTNAFTGFEEARLSTERLKIKLVDAGLLYCINISREKGINTLKEPHI